MNEGVPENISSTEEVARKRVESDLYSYIRNVDRVHEMVNDLYGLPLSSDPLFEILESTIKKDLVPLAQVLFSKAKESTGRERMRFIEALAKLKLFTHDYEGLLSSIPTNMNAFSELERKAYDELDHGTEETLKEALTRKIKKWVREKMSRRTEN